MKALSLKPDDRYAYVKFLQQDIEAYQNGFATSVEHAGAWTQFTLLVKRNKGIFTAIAAALVVILAGSTAFMMKVMASERRATTALRNFTAEQGRRQADRKQSAPAMVRSAKMFLEQGESDSAEKLLASALEYDGDLTEAYLVRALLRLDKRNYAGAAADAGACERLARGSKESRQLLSLARQAEARKGEGVSFGTLAELANRHGMPLFGTRFSKTLEERLPVYRAQIEKAWPGAGSRLAVLGGKLGLDMGGFSGAIASWKPLEGIPLSALDGWQYKAGDLAPLRGMPLENLFLWGAEVRDLTPLSGMPLKELTIGRLPVHDLEPLRGMPLERLRFGFSDITDFSPLKGAPLQSLITGNVRVSDLSPLKDIRLVELSLVNSPVADLAPLRGMPLRYLDLSATKVTSLAPLKGMQLEVLLLCTDGYEKQGLPITDLSPLAGMPLTQLDMRNVPATDLSPLRGMRLRNLNLMRSGVSDLSPLRGMPLESLYLDVTGVVDLEPLRGMPLRQLRLSECRVRDLSPLTGMRLEEIGLGNTAVTNIISLAGMRSLRRAVVNWGQIDLLGLMLQDTGNALAQNDLDQAGRLAQEAANAFRDVPALSGYARDAERAAMETIPAFKAWAKQAGVPPPQSKVIGGHHYLLVVLPMTWMEADEFSRKHGAHLVTITSEEEQKVVESLLPGSGSFVWLGGRADLAQGVWKWTWTTGEQWKDLRTRADLLNNSTFAPFLFMGVNGAWASNRVPWDPPAFPLSWNGTAETVARGTSPS